jgi:hypothetical protein
MQNQYGADQTLAAGNFVISGGVLTTKAAYGSSLKRLVSGGDFVVITIDAPGQGGANGINAAVNRNSAAVQISQLGQAAEEVFIDYGSSPLGIGIGITPPLAPNQIILGFTSDGGDSFIDPTGLVSYRILSCFDGVNNVT